MSDDIIFGEGLVDLYDSEKATLRDIFRLMHNRYRAGKLLTPLEEEARRAKYARELCDRVAEAGFVSEVEWEWESEEKDEDGIPLQQSPCVSDWADDQNLYYLPRLVVTGRTAKLLDYDHDRQAHDVREGTLDGIKGVIDVNTGLIKEDPKKRNIY